MKTTVKTTHSGKVTGSRMGPQLIALEFTSPLNFQGTKGVYMTLDAAHVLGMGLVRLAEQAEAERLAAEILADNPLGPIQAYGEACRAYIEKYAAKPAGGVRCHDADLCQAGQTACPSPKACGVAA